MSALDPEPASTLDPEHQRVDDLLTELAVMESQLHQCLVERDAARAERDAYLLALRKLTPYLDRRREAL